MAKRARGEVVVRNWKAGRGFALRFSAYGRRRYLTLGLECEGWTTERAQEELENVLADVRRGLWVPPRRGGSEGGGGGALSRRVPGGSGGGAIEVPATGGEMLFGEFAPWAMKVRRAHHGDAHHRNLRWCLMHLMPFFAEWPLAEIDAEAVDSYSAAKVEEGRRLQIAIDRGEPYRNDRGRVRLPLAATSINKTIKGLSWFLGFAVQYKKGATENAAGGKERLLKAEPKPPVFLDTAEQIEALLDAAAELDRDPGHLCCEREAIVGTLIFAGPRAHEIGYMQERDIDLANTRIFVGRSKTAAGLREIRTLPILHDILAAHKARPAAGGPDALAFATGTGGRRDRSNLRERVLAEVFERADQLLRGRGELPLPKGLSPHKMRHTFASVLVALGTDPAQVMRQIGHRSAAFTLDVYTHMMACSPEQRERLKALVEGERRWGPAPLGRLGAAAYQEPILRALATLGGSARRKEVMASLESELAPRFGVRDLEIVSGRPRWQADVDVARRRLLERGLVTGGSREGIWVLTRAGLEKAAVVSPDHVARSAGVERQSRRYRAAAGAA
ncbi:MAG TPA: site-specific integrase [Solirubrobacterales bacterium]|nr:site-specific integrase [Solirubrobacterales bacterium]